MVFDLRDLPRNVVGNSVKSLLFLIVFTLNGPKKTTNQTSIGETNKNDTFGMERMKLSDKNVGISRTSTPTNEISSTPPYTGTKRKETITTCASTKKNPILFNQKKFTSPLETEGSKPAPLSYATETPSKSNDKFTREDEWWNATCSFMASTQQSPAISKTLTHAAEVPKIIYLYSRLG